jgi:hypothetical protein
MAYLGKISAVLSANTQDFTRGLREAGQELSRFQKQASGLRVNLDSNALDKTLTNLQRFEKTIQEIKKQIAANPEQRSLFPDPNRLQQQFKAFENIGKPLTELKNKVEGLSQTMQAGLYPALGQIQAGFQNLYRGIQSGSTTYDKETARIEGLIGALNRLQKTAAAAADFGDLTKRLTASNTGASFYQPRAKESLQDSLALRNRAEAVPARFRGGVFADLAAAAEENAQKIEAQAARILQIQNRIGNAGPATPMNLLQARGQAQQTLNRLTSQQEFINSSYQKELRSAEIKQIVSPAAGSGVDALKSKFAALAASVREVGGAQFEPLISSVGRVVDQLNRGTASAEKAKAAIEKLAVVNKTLAAQDKASQLVSGMEGKALTSLRTQSYLDRDIIRRRAQLERTAAPFQGEMGPLTQAQDRQRSRYLDGSKTREQSGLAREEFNRSFLPRITALNENADKLGDGDASTRAKNLLGNAQRMDAALRRAFSAKDPDVAARSLQKYEAQLAGILPVLDRLEKKTKSLSDAQRLYGMFVSASGGRGDKLDPVLEGAASDIMTARQFRGQFAEGNSKGRVAVTQEILRVEGEILRLTKIRQLIEDKPGLSNDKRSKAYERNRKAIEAETQALLKLTAAESGGVFGERRVLAAAQRARKSTGSFGIAGAAAGQMAIQQGLFAIDDFSSATGGLEYKLRAVGNNITQFGLLIGQSGMIPGLSATTGLMLGLSAVIGTQVVLALARAVFKFDESEGAIKSLNSELEKSKNLANETAKAFQDMAKSIRVSAASPQQRAREQVKQEVEELKKRQEERVKASVSSSSPRLSEVSGRISSLEKQLENERDIGRRGQIRREIEKASREKAAIERVSILPPSMDEVFSTLNDASDAEILERGKRARADAYVGDFVYGDQNRPRLEVAKGNRPQRPTSAKDAIDAIGKKIAELEAVQNEDDPITRFMARNIPDFYASPINMAPGDARAFKNRDKIIAELTEQKSRLEGQVRGENDDRIRSLYEKGATAKVVAGSVQDDLAKMPDLSGGISERIYSEGVLLADAISEIEKRLEKDLMAPTDDLEKKASDAGDALSRLYAEADALARSVALGEAITTESRLSSGSGRVAGSGPSLAGTEIARALADYGQTLKNRDRAAAAGDSAGVDAANSELERIRNAAAAFDKAAYAVESFSRAASNAATELSRTLVQEAKSMADQLRRRANKLSGDPLEGGQSQDDLAEARKQQAQQEQDDRDMRRAVAAERLAFEQEVMAGRDPEGAALLNRIQAGKDAEGNKKLTPAQQEAARADAEQAQAELDARIARRPGVVAQSDKVDARDAAVQANLEAERVRREQLSLGMQAADSSADAAKRMFSETGNVGGALGARGIEDKIRDVRRKIGEAPAGSTVSKELEDELNRLQAQADETRGIAVTALVEKRQKAGTGFDAQMKAAEREMQGIGISGLQAPMTELEVRRADLERRRDEAITANDPAKAAGIQAEIDATDKLANELNAAAIAVAAFQQAANKAAMDLQNSVAREAEGMANEARRTANEAEAVFGANAPKTKEERERQTRLEADAKAAQKERDSAQSEIDAARVKYEEEIRGGMNPAAAARAEEIRKNEETANDKTLTPAERQAAKNEADRLRREQEAEFEARPEVKDARRRADEADIGLQKAKSAERGRDLGKSEMDRRKEEIDRKAGDIGNETEKMIGAGDRAGAQGLAERAAINMARDAAPLYAQLGDELMTARLQGPSRAALNASDIQTGEGAKELNRLLRGEDSAKDANLAEMQKQSGLLERIESAIENSTGFNVLGP